MSDLMGTKYGTVSQEATTLSGADVTKNLSAGAQELGQTLDGAMDKAGDVVNQFMDKHGAAITGGAATFARLMDPEHDFEL